jgi:hypothetical protein
VSTVDATKVGVVPASPLLVRRALGGASRRRRFNTLKNARVTMKQLALLGALSL